MKAKIFSEEVYESVLDWAHHGGLTVKRLVVKEAGSLAITLYNGEMYAYTGFSPRSKGTKFLSEVEVPDKLVEKAIAFVRAKRELDGFKNRFAALLD